MKRHNKNHFSRQVVLLVILLGLFLGFSILRKPSPLTAPTIKSSNITSNSLFFASNQEYSVTLGERNTNKPFVEYSLPSGNKISFIFKDVKGKLIAPETTDKTITFKEVSPSVHIRYTTLPKGLKEEIILNKQATNHIFNFSLNTTNAFPQAQTDTFYSGTFFDQKGKYLFHFEKPFAIDAHGSRTDNVTFQIKKDIKNNLYNLVLDVDREWLESTNRVYPIVIDPTITHDTTSEFATGQLNRVTDTGSGSSPQLESYFQELKADTHTLALYHFNESYCTTDRSGNSFTLSANGGITCNLGNLLGYKASGFAITPVSYSNTTLLDTALTSGTIEAWINPSNLSAVQTILYADSTSDTLLTLGTTGFLTFSTSGSTSLVTTTNAIPINTWTHIAATWTSTGHAIYINGNEVTRDTNTTTHTSQDYTTYIGVGAGGNTLPFSGSIDEVRISRIARTPEEIRLSASRRPYSTYISDILDFTKVAAWNSLKWNSLGLSTGDGETATASATSNLVAQWNFNETSGTSIANSAGVGTCGGTASNCNLTLAGFPDTSGQDVNTGLQLTSNNSRWGSGALDTSNTYTTSLLHMDGADTSTTFTDESGKTWTANGNAQVDTAQSVFGGASALFDGSGDYTSTPDNTDWRLDNGSNSIDWTIDFWVRFSGDPGTANRGFCGQSVDSNNNWFLALVNNTIQIFSRDTGVTRINISNTWNPADATWYHIAVVKNGTNYLMFVDGSQIGTTISSLGVIGDIAAGFTIGMGSATPYLHTGWIDEFRISKGVARWTSNFTPPNSAYYASLNDPASNAVDPSASFSIDTWIKTNTVSTTLLSNNNNNLANCTANGYYLGTTSTGFPIFNVDTNGATAGCEATVTGNKTITDSNWHHLAATFDQGASSAKIYLDGLLIGEDTSVASSITSVTGNITFASIGVITDSTRFYSRALTASEVLSNYNSSRIELQTRVGASADPNDGTWEAWKPTTGETVINAMDNVVDWATPSASIWQGAQIATSSSTVIKAEGNASLNIQQGIPKILPSTVALWHLDETGGTGAYLKDSTANAHHGTPSGTSLVDGISNKARSFNGSSDQVTAPDSDDWYFAANPFTIDFWINITNTTTGTNGFIEQYVDANNRWGFWLDTTNMQFNIISGGATKASYTFAPGLSPNTWYHVAITRSGTIVAIYINGVSQTLTVTTAISTNEVPNLASSLYFGSAYFNSGWRYLGGKMDELRVSKGVAFSAEDVAEAYRMGRDHVISETITSTNLSSATKLPFFIASDRLGTFMQMTYGESAFANNEPDGNTVGLWHLDEQSGSTAYIKDSSGNSNHGTPTGTTFVQGKIGKARTFNGSSDYIRAASSGYRSADSLGSISAWIRLNNLTNSQTIFQSADEATDNYFLQFRVNATTGTLSILQKNNDTYDQVSSNTALVAGNWYHVAVVSSGTAYTLYINGKSETLSVGSGSNTGDWFADTPNRDNIMIGMNKRSTSSDYLAGTIDEVIVDNVARTANEIRQAFEVSARTHNITIDFKARLGPLYLITDSTDLSFSVNETSYGASLAAVNLFLGDKIIVKENYDGTEYIAQGTVNAVNSGTGDVTVVSWDTGSTFPAAGYTTNATVFKWQREYFDITNPLSSQKDAVTRLTYRITDGSIGGNIWIDDLKSNTGYLTNPFGSTITSSLGNRYFQYKVIFSQNDLSATSSALTSLTLDYTQNEAPNIPSLDFPSDTSTGAPFLAVLKTTATDNNSDTLKYKIQLCTDAAMTANCKTFDQTVSTTGWSATSYASGAQATYTIQVSDILNVGTVYYWKSYAIDQAGINTWSSTQSTPYSFTTNQTANIPSLDQPTNSATNVSTISVLKTTTSDPDSDFLRYKVLICKNVSLTQDCQTIDQTSSQTGWSGQNTETNTAYTSGTQATYTFQTPLAASTTYYWKSYAIDPNGSNTWSSTQTTPYSFTTKNASSKTSQCNAIKAVDNSNVSINWIDTSDEEGFQVWRSVDGSLAAQLGSNLAANTIQLLDSTVSSPHNYIYLIRSFLLDGSNTLYSDWCITPAVNLSIGEFKFNGLNMQGIKID